MSMEDQHADLGETEVAQQSDAPEPTGPSGSADDASRDPTTRRTRRRVERLQYTSLGNINQLTAFRRAYHSARELYDRLINIYSNSPLQTLPNVPQEPSEIIQV